jgi:signal transduction histidine kinase
MNIYSVLLILVSILTGILTVYSAKFRKSDMGSYLFLILLVISIFSFSYAFELNSKGIEYKVFWLRAGYVGLATISPLLLLFTLSFSNKSDKISPLMIFSLSLLALFVLFANYTNDFHHLYYRSISVRDIGPFSILVFDRGPLYWPLIIYTLIFNVLSMALLLNIIVKKRGEFRKHAFLIFISILPPWIINLIYILNQSPHGVDFTAFGFLFTAVALSISLFNFNLLGIIPIALGDVFKCMDDGAIILDSKKRIVDFNQTAQQFYPQLKKNRIGKNINDVIGDPEFPVSDGTESEYSYELGTEKGSPVVYLRARVMPVTDKRDVRIGFLIMIYNITNFREYENKLRELSETKDKLFSIVSHDLRGPFGNIIELMELMREQIDDYDKKDISRMLETIIVQSGKTYRLVENLLVWSKSQINQMVCNPIKVDVKEIVNDVIENLKLTYSRKNLTVLNEIADYKYATADIEMIRIIFRNIINNAIKYCNINGSITITSRNVDGMVEFAVADDGIGMSEESLSKLFEFGNIKSVEGTMSEQGNHLGLQICKELLGCQKGLIRAESVEGSGSTFYITLPWAI